MGATKEVHRFLTSLNYVFGDYCVCKQILISVIMVIYNYCILDIKISCKLFLKSQLLLIYNSVLDWLN